MIQISIKLVPLDPADNMLVLAQVMAWLRTGDNKSLPEPVVTQRVQHIKCLVLCSHEFL